MPAPRTAIAIAALFPVAALAAGVTFTAPDDTALRALIDEPQASSTQPADLAGKMQREMDRYNQQIQTQLENAQRSDALHAQKVQACVKQCDAVMADFAKKFQQGQISIIAYKLASKSWLGCKQNCFK